MTAIDTVRMVEMFLDDSIDWYFPDILRAINEAQMALVRKWYMAEDEFAIQPLYRRDWGLADGGVINYRDNAGNITTPAEVLYPRAAIVYVEGEDDTNGYTANYVDYYQYIHNNYPAYEPYQQVGDLNRYPKTAYYTLEQQHNAAQMLTFIRFNSQTNSRIDLTFIKKPAIFNVDYNNAANDVALEVESVYHPQVCALAAEILNDIDVMEAERGELAFQNQKVTIVSATDAVQ